MSSPKYKFHKNCWWDSHRDILYKEKPTNTICVEHFDSISEYRYYRKLLRCTPNINVKRQINLLGWRIDFMLEGDNVGEIREKLPFSYGCNQSRLFVEYKGILNSELADKTNIIRRFGVVVVCPYTKVIDTWAGLAIINPELFLRFLK